MIPEVGRVEQIVAPTRERPSRTYGIDLVNKRILGMVDGLEAIGQAVYKILGTERYAHMIYGWGYGAELEKFIGKDFDYIKSAIEGEIKEALYMDGRITKVNHFQIIRQEIDSCLISFVVETNMGEIQIEEVIAV